VLTLFWVLNGYPPLAIYLGM